MQPSTAVPVVHGDVISPSTPPPTRGFRTRLWSHGAVAIAALALGVGGTMIGTRGRLFGGSAPPASASANPHAGMPGTAASASATPASSGVYISPARQQLVGVRTSKVASHTLDATLRTVGTVAYDETRLAQIHTRTAGWIEQVFVDFVGKPVRRGQALFNVYSPDLVTTQSDLVIALRARDDLASSAYPEARRGGDALVAATRERLKRWGISDGEIARLERTREVTRTMTLSSPFDGIIVERTAFAGQYVTPEMTAFKIADLSRVWVIGQAFEYEARRISVGQVVHVEFPYGQAAVPLEGKITFIYPDVDTQTRRVRFRAEFKNPNNLLKPETYVTVVVRGEPSVVLAVPREGVIDTGTRQYVILAKPNGYFEPRDVKIGAPIGDFYPVIEGVSDGDEVVTSAQFLVDSETNLQSAMQAMALTMPGMDMGGGGDMSGMDMGASAPPPPMPSSAPPTSTPNPQAAPPSKPTTLPKPSPKPTPSTPPSPAIAPSPTMTMPMNMPMPMPSSHSGHVPHG
jgi:Cu(I)/Ag(I) efflux system membrane fusion protein